VDEKKVGNDVVATDFKSRCEYRDTKKVGWNYFEKTPPPVMNPIEIRMAACQWVEKAKSAQKEKQFNTDKSRIGNKIQREVMTENCARLRPPA
jgi:hypothetical protein